MILFAKKSKTNLLFIFRVVILLLFSVNSFSQQRKDEEMPKIISSTIKSVTNLEGWAKNDVGKWYQFNSFQRGQEISRIELFTISYESKNYLCIAAFDKSFYIKSNIKQTEYSSFFWILDTTKMEDLDYSDTSVHTRLYGNIFVSSVIGKSLPITHNELLLELKRCFIGTSIEASHHKETFFIKYRNDYKLKKTQFFIGDFLDLEAELNSANKQSKDEHDFTEFALLPPFEPNSCKDKNRNLSCIYFEINKYLFENCFKRILNN